MWCRRAASILIVLATACTSTAAKSLPSSASASRGAVPTAVPSPSARQVALAETKTLLGLVRVPPGSETRSNPPVQTLTKPAQSSASPYLLDSASWWTVPLDAENAWSWLHSHRPNGVDQPVVAVRGGGSGSGHSSSGSFTYLIYVGHPTTQYTSPTLLVEIAPDGAGSAIRADGQDLWVPPKPLAEMVPAGVKEIRLVETQLAPGSPSKTLKRATIRGHEAVELTSLANDLIRDNRGVVSCAMDRGVRISATFLTRDGGTEQFVENPYCGSVAVTAGGVSQPPLLLSGPFAVALRADLGSSLHMP
jgi:hypothetical protein